MPRWLGILIGVLIVIVMLIFIFANVDLNVRG
jgi:uncharacterized integral membrane protein